MPSQHNTRLALYVEPSETFVIKPLLGPTDYIRENISQRPTQVLAVKKDKARKVSRQDPHSITLDDAAA